VNLLLDEFLDLNQVDPETIVSRGRHDPGLITLTEMNGRPAIGAGLRILNKASIRQISAAC